MYWMPIAVLALAAPTKTDAVLLDFHATWCGPCRQMTATVDELAQRGYAIRRVDVDREPQLAAKYRVVSVPCFVMLAGGREVDRVVGPTSYGRLAEMFQKASLATAPPPPAPPATMPAAMLGTELPAVPSGPMPSLDLGQVPDLAETGLAISATAPDAAREELVPTASTAGPTSDAQLIAASVRLRIKDPDGYSCGSGTIIDARRGWALILTCGHIFRDSQGKEPVLVDVFASGRPQRVVGEVRSYDLERDLGLVKIRTDGLGPIVVARVAPPGVEVQPGDAVMSVGCDNGADPSVRHTRIRSKDRFLGPPNLQTEGQPIEGRSGGGLFSSDGWVIGVCNAADPREDQGLFAALASIHAELDRVGLAYVYATPQESPAIGTLAAVAPPSMPEPMPTTIAPGASDGGLIHPTSARSPDEVISAQQGLSPEERAALEEIARRKAQGDEVILIVRPRANPQAPSEVFLLNNASPAFLRRLESLAPGARQPAVQYAEP